MSDDVNFLSQLVRDSMELQAQVASTKSDDQDIDIMKPLQVLTLHVSKRKFNTLKTEKEKEKERKKGFQWWKFNTLKTQKKKRKRKKG